MDVPRFLVTGCGRSGTGYTATFLRALGLSCGHEQLFNPAQLASGALVWPSALPGESSWLAAPFVESLPAGTAVLHQVREPVAVVRSFLRIRFFETRSSYREFAEALCPELAEGTPLERCLRYWLRWNELAERAAAIPGTPYLRYRLEDMGPELVARMLATVGAPRGPEAIERAFAERPKDYNSRGDKTRDGAVRWDLFPEGDLLREVEAQARRYGYAGVAAGGSLQPQPA